jgi:Bacterial PH domain
MGRSRDEDSVDPPEERAPRGLPLQSGEVFVLSVNPSPWSNFYRYLYTLGLYEIWRRHDTAIVTDRRVLVSRGIFNREENSISMAHVEGARYVRRGLNSYATITVVNRGGRKTEKIGPMSARHARKFVAEVLQYS